MLLKSKDFRDLNQPGWPGSYEQPLKDIKAATVILFNYEIF